MLVANAERRQESREDYKLILKVKLMLKTKVKIQKMLYYLRSCRQDTYMDDGGVVAQAFYDGLPLVAFTSPKQSQNHVDSLRYCVVCFSFKRK